MNEVAAIYIGVNVVGIVQRNYDLNNFHLILAQEAEDAFLVDRKGYVKSDPVFQKIVEITFLLCYNCKRLCLKIGKKVYIIIHLGGIIQ